jgi:cell wall-associated NlpC family hydrolase
MTKPQDYIDAARDQIGTTFHHQGRASGVGVDCVGLLVIAAQKLGIEPKDMKRYRRVPNMETLISFIKDSCKRADNEDIRPGAILVMKWPRSGALHVGIVSERGTIIHAYGPGGVRRTRMRQTCGAVVEQSLDARYKRMLHSVWYPNFYEEGDGPVSAT